MLSSLVVFAVFLLLVALGVPIAAAMVAGALTPQLFFSVRGADLLSLLADTWSGANSTPILALPLFILSGVIMGEGGLSRRLFRFFACFVGRLPAGMPCACVLTCLFYGAISGSGPATTAAVGAMCLPILVELGYDRRWSAGLITVAGGLGVIIPPSIPFILYALATGESPGELFLGGVLPGLVIGAALMLCAVIHCRRCGEDRAAIDARVREFRGGGFLSVLRESFFALLCPVIVLGGIYGGVVGPTEAATVSVLYALFVSLFVYRSIRVRDLPGLLLRAVRAYAPLCFVLAFATAFGRVLTLTRATAALGSFLTQHFTHPLSLLAALTLLFLLLGMVMDTGPAIVILAPILLPAAKQLGVDPIHLGVVLVCCLSIGLATPPFGLDLFVAGNLSGEEPMAVAKSARGFLLAFLLALALIVAVPQLSTALLP